jgi:DHA2 family multidrug resistance protein
MASAATPRSRPAPPPQRTVAPEDDTALLETSNPTLLAFGIMLASMIQVLDTTITNRGGATHAIQRLGRLVGNEVTWVLTSYIVATGGQRCRSPAGWPTAMGSRRLFLSPQSPGSSAVVDAVRHCAEAWTEMVLFRALARHCHRRVRLAA